MYDTGFIIMYYLMKQMSYGRRSYKGTSFIISNAFFFFCFLHFDTAGSIAIFRPKAIPTFSFVPI